MNLLMKGIAAVLLWMAAGLLFACQQEAGELEYRCVNGELAGQWLGLPGLHLAPETVASRKSEFIPIAVPGQWRRDENNPLSQRGSMTLWLKLKLSDKRILSQQGLYPGAFQSAHKIYIKNSASQFELVFDNLSSLASTGDSGALAARIYPLPKLATETEIVVHLTNNNHWSGGSTRAPVMAELQQLNLEFSRRLIWHSLLIGAFVLVAIYSLSLAWYSAEKRVLSWLLGFISLVAAGRVLLLGGLAEQLLAGFKVDQYHYLNLFSFYLLAFLCSFCQPYLLPKLFSSSDRLRWLVKFAALVPLLALLASPLQSLSLAIGIGRGIQIFFFVAAFTYLLFLLRCWLKSHAEYWPALSGSGLVLLGASIDIYSYIADSPPYIELFSLSFLIFVILHSGHFAWRYAGFLSREKELRQQTQEGNATLELRVQERTAELEQANAMLSRAALTDALTGLPNRRAYETELQKETRRAKRMQSPMSFALVDIDWFKKVNDSYGHDFGDKVLKSISSGLRQRLRATDFIARIGGEEFAIILPNTASAEAMKVLDGCCDVVNDLPFYEHTEYQASISIGTASWQEWVSHEELYKRADNALYQAKNHGKNQVVYAAVFTSSEDV